MAQRICSLTRGKVSTSNSKHSKLSDLNARRIIIIIIFFSHFDFIANSFIFVSGTLKSDKIQMISVILIDSSLGRVHSVCVIWCWYEQGVVILVIIGVVTRVTSGLGL